MTASRHSPSARHTILLLVIILGGFFLRVHELGRDGLRLDEAGQALAAIQPTLGEMIAIEKTHAAAMPLDYLGTRLAAEIGTQEFLLRYPSVIWGTLSIALIYLLSRRLTLSAEAGLVAAFIMALSPNHIYYAQELRFYASLQAFTLLSTVVLVIALQRPSWTRWMLYAGVTVAGAYFHPYVLLTVVTGGIYLVLKALRTKAVDRDSWISLITAATVIGLLFLPGYLLLGTNTTYNFDPLQWTGTWQRFVLGGLDWTNRINSAPSALTTAWALLNLVLIGLGLLDILRYRSRYLMLISLTLSVVVSMLLIIVTTLAEGYWLIPRQLIHLSPTLMILAAVGVEWLATAVARRSASGRSADTGRLAILIAIGLFIILAAGQKLNDYYNSDRATGREVALSLIAHHQQSELIYLIPANEAQSYLFYMTAAGREDLANNLVPSSFELLPDQLMAVSGRVHLALASPIDDSRQEFLRSLGLERIEPDDTDPPSRYQHFTRD